MEHVPLSIRAFFVGRVPALDFGVGVLDALVSRIREAGIDRIGLLTGSSSFRETSAFGRLTAQLAEAGVASVDFVVAGEPGPKLVDPIVETLRESEIQAVVAIGGGSVLDAGKAAAAGFHLSGSIRDYLEGVGTRKPSGLTLPVYAVPTTAGTGTEATKNAVLSEIGPQGFKKSLRHDNYTPQVAIIDPQLAVGCPSTVTAASGMDAITQLIEAWVSTGASAFTDALAESGLRWVARSFETAVHDGRDLEARAGMAYAAYLSGICLANAGLGIVHGAASPAGARMDIPHGAFCGTMLAASVRYTLARLHPGDSEASVALDKYARAGEVLTGRSWGSAADNRAALVAELERLTDTTAMPRLAQYGFTAGIAREVAAATAGKSHPVGLDAHDVEAMLLERI